MKNQKGIANSTIIIILLIAIIIVGVIWYLYINMDEESNKNTVTPTDSVSIFNGVVPITCAVDSDCTAINSKEDYSKCCGWNGCQGYDIAVNKEALQTLKNQVRDNEACSDTICPIGACAPPDENSISCSNGLCKLVTEKSNTNTTININSVNNVNAVTNLNTVSNTNTTEILPDYCETNDDCGTGGCSNQVCDTIADAAASTTTCEVQEWHQCLDLTACGCNNNRCSWEQNEEYLSCMDEYAP